MSTSSSDPFINPYQFIDISEPIEKHRDELLGTYPIIRELKTAGADLGHLTHDRWLEGSYSGHFVCTLMTILPVVVGSQQTAATSDAYGRVEPFRYRGKIALPASSLRGMLSSIAEIASGSAPRILDRRGILSYRVDLSDALSAMAMVERDLSDPTKLVLRPLAVPTFEIKRKSPGKWMIDDFDRFSRKWSKCFPGLSFKYYFGKDQIPYEDSSFVSEDGHRRKYECPAAALVPRFQREYDIVATENKWDLTVDGKKIPIKVKIQDGRYFVLGGYAGSTPAPHDEETSSSGAAVGYVRGIEAAGETVQVRKYDVFLREVALNTPTLPLPEEVVRRYVRLAEEAYESALAERRRSKGRTPAVLYPRNAPKNKADGFRPRPGDIVFFDTSDKDGSVIEISYSAAWRRYALRNTGDNSFEAADIHDFFEASEERAGRRLRPVTAETAGTPLSRAEALFGFVADTGVADEEGDRAGLSYAGRVQVGFATLGKRDSQEDPLDNRKVLRVLASPKLPSESFYFHTTDVDTKGPLSLTNHRPNGTKMYVHNGSPRPISIRKIAQGDDQARQKLEVRPISKKTKFIFRVYFENLDLRELQLLAFAITPSDNFCHKIGLGRSIGMGTVSIKVKSLVLWDRGQRYIDPFDTGHQQQFDGEDNNTPLAPRQLAAGWRRLLEEALPQTARALDTLGRVPPKDGPAVAHPFALDQQIHTEDKTFSWSANNKRLAAGKRQTLGPIRDGKLSTLKPNGNGSKGSDKSGRK
jgi:CRISPR-associated protein (TIGR03986 family)